VLGVALAAAWYINKMPNPFQQQRAPAAKTEPPKAVPAETARPADKNGKTADAKPRFDFYKILPGVEEPATDQQLREAKSTARESFYLQAGAFQKAPDADNLKARLALIGVEVGVEPIDLADKGTWYRVRIGPYTKVEEINRLRQTLAQNGIEATLVKIKDPGSH